MSALSIEHRIAEPVEYYKSDVPEGSSGNWHVERFWIRPLAADEAVSNNGQPHWARRRPGWYTRLRVGRIDMMTDLYDEWWTQRAPIEQAHRRGGQVLMSGLGLGLVFESILRPPEGRVQQITVLEASEDVIQLVAGHMRKRYADRLQIIHADAFTWQPPKDARYSVVWHDIWPNPFAVPEAEVEKLHQHYAPYADWQDSWTSKYFV